MANNLAPRRFAGLHDLSREFIRVDNVGATALKQPRDRTLAGGHSSRHSDQHGGR
jgi:hypothetical protein